MWGVNKEEVPPCGCSGPPACLPQGRPGGFVAAYLSCRPQNFHQGWELYCRRGSAGKPDGMEAEQANLGLALPPGRYCCEQWPRPHLLPAPLNTYGCSSATGWWCLAAGATLARDAGSAIMASERSVWQARWQPRGGLHLRPMISNTCTKGTP